jgi:hypothetical protein
VSNVLLAAWYLRELTVRTRELLSADCAKLLQAVAASRHEALETVTVELQWSHHQQPLDDEDEAAFAEEHAAPLFERLPRLAAVRVFERFVRSSPHVFTYDRQQKRVLLATSPPARRVWP